MKTAALLVLCFAACAMAAPTSDSIRKLPALEHKEIHDELGQYTLRYVTAEGTIVYEKGWLVPNPDGEEQVMITEGEVIYVGDDGKVYSTKYTAGFDGYKPLGAHLEVEPLKPVIAPEVMVDPMPLPAEVVVVA